MILPSHPPTSTVEDRQHDAFKVAKNILKDVQPVEIALAPKLK